MCSLEKAHDLRLILVKLVELVVEAGRRVSFVLSLLLESNRLCPGFVPSEDELFLRGTDCFQPRRRGREDCIFDSVSRMSWSRLPLRE
eukprot:12881931-Prorocentrum_lima.AAC.1